MVWTRLASTGGCDVARAVAVSNDGFVYVTGAANGTLNNQPFTAGGNEQLTSQTHDTSNTFGIITHRFNRLLLVEV